MRSPEQLREYQGFAIDHIIENDQSGLILDMGLGKTVITLTAIDYLIFNELEIYNALIIGTKNVSELVWDAEIEEWEHLQRLKVSKIVGTEKNRLQALKQKAHIYTISRDNIAWLCDQYGGLKLPFDMIVVDESSSFKNNKSQRFKALKRAIFSVERRVILTGTPAPNSLIELWPQMYLLDKGERLGRSIGAYRTTYFNPGKRKGHVVYNYNIQKGAEEQIYEKISDICVSMKATDYIDMPELITVTKGLHMPSSLAYKYEEFERDLVLSVFKDGVEDSIIAMNAAALSNKLLQFANGAVYDEDKNVHEMHSLKLDALEELIEEANGRPVFVAWTYRSDLYRIKERLKKYNVREFKGAQDRDDWNAGKIQVLLSHPASVGHGLNLQKGGNTVVWFGQTWSLELYQQLNARLYRQGQTSKKVVVYLLSTLGTLDQDVISARERKNNSQEALISAIKAKIKKYL